MRPASLASLALLAALAPAAALAAPPKLPSGAGEIRLVEMSARTSERDLVEAFVPAAKDQPMESLLYDLDGDGKPEVVARLKGPGMCDAAGKACRSLVFRKETAGWKLVLDRPSQRIEAAKPGYGAMRELVLDGRDAYSFTPNGYRLDFAATGKVVEVKPAPASYSSSLARQFGVGAERLVLKRKDVGFKIAAIEAKAGEPLLFARMEGPGACGAVLGCPWRLLRVKGGAYEVASEGFAGEKVALLPVAREGWRDIVVQTPRGYAVYGWSGKRYVLSENRKEGSAR